MTVLCYERHDIYMGKPPVTEYQAQNIQFIYSAYIRVKLRVMDNHRNNKWHNQRFPKKTSPIRFKHPISQNNEQSETKRDR